MTTAIRTRPATPDSPPPRRPTRSPLALLRRGWRRLISMRTALVLLFLLAIAAVPGSLLPQRPLNPAKVATYLASHGAYGRLLDRLGFFDVFGTPWFAAIYLLLGISLIGCLIPRIRLHAKAMLSKPLPAPKNLSRLPESDSFTAPGSVDEVAGQLRTTLGRRWRTTTRDESAGVPGASGVPGVTVSAEKGYSRETGNLVFHVALLAALVSIAAGKLYGYSASIVVTEGSGFCNAVVSYDSFRPGRFVQNGNVAPFCIDSLDKFTATYLSTGEPSQFAADVTYSRGKDGVPEHDRITVNHPLRLEGDRVYLIGHGFAPQVTVRRPDVATQTLTADYIPQDPTNFFSEGAFEFQYRADANGRHTNDIGINGFFAPTPAQQADGTYASVAPQANNPVLGIFVYQGDLGHTGLPRSVYSLDQNQIDAGKLKQVAKANLRRGQVVSLPDGTTVTFDGWRQWASLQVSHDPTQAEILVAAVAMVAGLIGSLAVRRRRLWLRLTPAADAANGPRTVVEIGGLARSDAGSFSSEFTALASRLRTATGSASPDRSG